VSSDESDVEDLQAVAGPISGQELIDAARRKRFKSAFPDKEDDLVHDVGSLASFDYHPVDTAELKRRGDGYLQEAARDNVQLLFNQIFTQPALKNADGVFAELPRRKTVVPREKPMPREKPKTKWDEFAQIKGIQKGKRSSKRWNEERGEFVPRYGKGSVNNDKMQDWVMELPSNAPDDFDMRGDAKRTKKKAMEKQKKQERSNKARARAKGQRQMAGSASVALMTGGKKLDRKQLRETVAQQLHHTTESTASAGVFVDKKEKKKNKVVINHKGLTSAPGTEREKQTRVLDRVLDKKAAPHVAMDKAVARHKYKEKQADQLNKTKNFGKNKRKKR